MPERCKGCRFWFEDTALNRPDDTDFAFGKCRREPPRLVAPMVAAVMPKPTYGSPVDLEMETISAFMASAFPATHSGDWCGQHEPKNGSVPL